MAPVDVENTLWYLKKRVMLKERARDISTGNKTGKMSYFNAFSFGTNFRFLHYTKTAFS